MLSKLFSTSFLIVLFACASLGQEQDKTAISKPTSVEPIEESNPVPVQMKIRARMGDTPASIAMRHNVSAEEVAQLNRVGINTEFQVGQEIKIPVVVPIQAPDSFPVLPIPTDIKNVDERVTQLIAQAEARFKEGELHLKANKRLQARDKFDQAVDIILESGIDVRATWKLEAYFFSLVERISRLEAPQQLTARVERAQNMQADSKGKLRQDKKDGQWQEPGFKHQKFEPAPLDGFAKLILTDKESKVDPKGLSNIETAKNAIDIKFDTNPLIQQSIDYYQGRGRSTMETGLRRSGQFMQMARRIFREEGVPEDVTWLAQVGSQWNPKNSTPHGDGLWQFPANKGKEYGLRLTPWINERMSLEKATRASARYLRDLYNHFGNWELALAAYNTGQSNVDRAIARAGSRSFWKIYPYIEQETRNYVPNILATMLIAKNPERYGFRNIRPDAPLTYDVVQVPTAISLQLAAQATNASVDYIRMLNPELQRDTTPRGEAQQLRIPAGKANQFVTALRGIPIQKRDAASDDVHESGATSSAQTLKLPYKDVGACPFECCTYRQWIVNEDTIIYKEMRDDSPIAFTVRNREKVTGITGVVITTEAGQVKALRNAKLEHISVNAGDVLYTLTYLGEGYYKVWYQGKITTEAFYEEPSLKVLSEPQGVWWVKIRNRKGQIGWTRLSGNFDNQDACGGTPEGNP